MACGGDEPAAPPQARESEPEVAVRPASPPPAPVEPERLPAPPQPDLAEKVVPAPPDVATRKIATAPRSHTVRPGETLMSIAAAHYQGDRSQYRKIFEANRDVLSDPDNIRTGLTLTIP